MALSVEMEARGRRRRETRARARSVRFDLSEAEYAELASAATAARLARGAFAARATLAAARGTTQAPQRPADEVRELLAEVMRSATLVQRIGVNLNQAVAKLNATGEPPGSLVPIAERCTRAVDRLDQVAERVRSRLR